MAERIQEGSQNYGRTLVDAYSEFREQHGFSYVVGVLGGSSSETLPQTSQLLVESLTKTSRMIGKFAVLSGGTKGGIPELAVDIGNALELPTIGVFPEGGSKYALYDKLDLAMSVPHQFEGGLVWGNETSVLVSIPDIFLLSGGEWGTLVEVSMIMKRNSYNARKGLPTVPVVSIDNNSVLAKYVNDMASNFSTPLDVFFQFNDSEDVANLIASCLTS